MVFSYIMCCSREKIGISWAVLWSGILFLLVLLYTLLINMSRKVYPIVRFSQKSSHVFPAPSLKERKSEPSRQGGWARSFSRFRRHKRHVLAEEYIFEKV